MSHGAASALRLDAGEDQGADALLPPLPYPLALACFLRLPCDERLRLRIVNRAWRAGGLPAVASYWRAFFAAEPGGEVEVRELPERVEINVRVCPAIRHLRAGNREIVREYCRHCHILGEARAAEAGLQMRLSGGDGACVHTYATPAAALPPQDPAAIREVAS